MCCRAAGAVQGHPLHHPNLWCPDHAHRQPHRRAQHHSGGCGLQACGPSCLTPGHQGRLTDHLPCTQLHCGHQACDGYIWVGQQRCCGPHVWSVLCGPAALPGYEAHNMACTATYAYPLTGALFPLNACSRASAVCCAPTAQPSRPAHPAQPDRAVLWIIPPGRHSWT